MRFIFSTEQIKCHWRKLSKNKQKTVTKCAVSFPVPNLYLSNVSIRQWSSSGVHFELKNYCLIRSFPLWFPMRSKWKHFKILPCEVPSTNNILYLKSLIFSYPLTCLNNRRSYVKLKTLQLNWLLNVLMCDKKYDTNLIFTYWRT